MKKCYFFFSGYNAVSMASAVLDRYHITNRVVKAPVSIRNSCSFAVMTMETDAEMATYVLERANMSILHREFAENQMIL